ncbi:MAG: sulfatase-like hydrolase/transferase [Planctomycetota bacterium]|jgi:arylsulfatase A-like enzyme
MVHSLKDQKLVSRRDFVKAAAVTAAMGPFVSGLNKIKRKPNLLFILTDQQRADTMAAYGNRKIHAPNLNKLAKESIVFRRAYVSQPVCTPSRCTMLTGLWPHTAGLTENNIALPLEAPTLPEILGDPDYRTGYMGKWHLGDEVFGQRGFHEWESIEDIYWRFFSEDRDIDQKSTYDRFLRSLGYKPDRPSGHFSRNFAAKLPIEQCKPKFLEVQACDFLRRNRHNPFILYVSFLEPHSPFFGPLNDEHKLSEVKLPINFNDPPGADEPEAYRRRYQKYLKNGFKGDPLTTEDKWRHLIAKYWGLVTQVDRSVGAILETLERLDLADQTIVVFTSDHGEMMGSHRLVTKGVMYEEATRVPWLIRAPALALRQRIVDNPVSHIDLVPTLLDLMGRAGAANERALPGKSLRPLVQGKSVKEDYVYIEWNAGNSLQKGRNPGGKLRKSQGPQGINSRAVVSPEGWKLCLHDHDRNQLYNLNKDPGEITNLYNSPGHQEIIRKLTARIRRWQQQVDDTVKMGT